ncbi:MAG: hypothetical protein GKR90_21490 [Pseudomonadales bacterium]|nr:hypothetical protein [Pseudomonadales bacterium]
MDASAKYLARYAERHVAEELPTGTFSSALVIPAFNESASTILAMHDQAVAAGALLLVVVNYPEYAGPTEITNTRILLEELNSVTSKCLFILDCTENPLPQEQGVGLARKIGTDVAFKLYNAGQLRSPWLYMSDADVSLPDNYFSHVLDGTGAFVFAHRHHADDHTLQQASNLYDQHMAYYIAGLTFAGSRYAFPTIGSTIVVHAETYAQVRGFPRKNAGEDFYLLNKVVKIAPVRYSADVVLTISARRSQRVPFGTGPALEKIAGLLVNKPDAPSYSSYNFGAFELLREAIASLAQFATTGEFSATEPITDILKTLGWRQKEALFRSQYQARQRGEAILDWFDGLKTLKFMHSARSIYPDRPLLDTLPELPQSVRATIAAHYLGDPDHN